MKLYPRFCIACGGVVWGLFDRRPFPLTRRCELHLEFEKRFHRGG